MNEKEAVSLAAFRDLVDTAVEDGIDSITVAAVTFAKSVSEEEFVQAIYYAAKRDVEVMFVPDFNERPEDDYNPQDEDKKKWQLEQLNNLLLNPIKNYGKKGITIQ